MSLPTIEPIPEENTPLPPARRRRQRRMILPQDSSERAEFVRELARRMVPSFDFFLFSLLSGLALGIAMLLDAPALFVLAALIAPFMAPTLGIALGSVAGTVSFILRSLGSLSIGSLIVFLCGAMTGWAASMQPGRGYSMAAYNSHFSWPGFFLLVLGAALTTYLIARAPYSRPLVSSVAIAYGLYLPAGAAGFGLTSGIAGLWPDALVLFAVHLVWAIIAAIIVLALLGLRPLNAQAYVLSVVFALAGLLLVFVVFNTPFTRPSANMLSSGQITGGFSAQKPSPQPSSTPAQNATASQTAASNEPTATKQPEATRTNTATPTRTLVPTQTATVTITPVPTPVWARINASEGNGALVRAQANYTAPVVQSLLNGTLVEVLPEVVENGGAAWVHVRLVNGKDGWIVRALLRTATPAPGW